MRAAGVTLHKSPEKELEEFLASKPAWMRRVLQEDFSSFSRAEQLEWIVNQDRLGELKAEYEVILQKIPTRWKEYRKRLKENSPTAGSGPGAEREAGTATQDCPCQGGS